MRENDGQLDYEFFSLLTGSIEMARAEGEEDRAKRLLGLREKLLEFVQKEYPEYLPRIRASIGEEGRRVSSD